MEKEAGLAGYKVEGIAHASGKLPSIALSVPSTYLLSSLYTSHLDSPLPASHFLGTAADAAGY